MTGFDPNRTAAALLERRRSRVRLEPLGPDLAPRTEDEAAAAQRALAQQMGADPPGGFKIGATARRMQAHIGLSGPMGGFMPDAGLYPSGITLKRADFQNPGVECEIAVRLGRDLPPGPCSPEQARAAVGELFAAIEVVDNRYSDLADLGTPTIIADQVFHAAAVLGEPFPGWQELDLPGLAGRMSIDGTVRDEGVGADLLGDPMRCLAWLAGSAVSAAFGGLLAGQVVLLGSVTPPVWLARAAAVEVAFPPLPEVVLHLN